MAYWLEHPFWVWEVSGSNPGWVIANISKMARAASLLDAQHLKGLSTDKQCWEGNGKPPSVIFAKKLLWLHQCSLDRLRCRFLGYESSSIHSWSGENYWHIMLLWKINQCSLASTIKITHQVNLSPPVLNCSDWLLPPPPKMKEVMFSPLSLCLFVWEYLKKLWTDLDEILWTGSVCDKDELIRFWWRSASDYETL